MPSAISRSASSKSPIPDRSAVERKGILRPRSCRARCQLHEKYTDYDRKAVFGENPYFRFFKKFKKTYPVMQQFESVLFKGRPFPEDDPVMGVPFLLELTTFVLSGTHDIDRMDGPLTIFTPSEKLPFPGMRAASTHTYPERHLRPR